MEVCWLVAAPESRCPVLTEACQSHFAVLQYRALAVQAVDPALRHRLTPGRWVGCRTEDSTASAD